ncbi:MBL fold metallo-hydrolase RNA specificity domain-containing protein [Planctomycetota bacterium]
MKPPTLRCFGAVRTVTGSKHLIEANGDRILLECGLFQGRRAESRVRNREFPFDPETITSVVLSHAHIDHAGNVPSLVKNGFTGNVYCTSATKDLAGILLEDSAYLQERDARYYNKKARRRKDPDRIEPLYTIEHARTAMDRFRPVPYNYKTEVGRGIYVTFRDAGHIIGSSTVHVEIEAGNGATRSLTFSGDFGRPDVPILRDPEPITPANVIVSESTYGNRLHPRMDEEEDVLLSVIRKTADRGGKVIVPAFSVGRTQNLVYWLHTLFLDGRLPQLPIFVDSPLSSKATLVYRGHPECYDRETHELFLEEGRDPFGFERLTFTTSVEGSKALNERKEACVIIASAGMCEAGRILHHFQHHAADERSTILIVGFMAEHTLGRRIVDRVETIKIYGEVIPLRAQVKSMSGLSAHADQNGLIDMFRSLPEDPTRRALLVHGELPQSEALQTRLRDELGVEAVIPEEGQSFEI